MQKFRPLICITYCLVLSLQLWCTKSSKLDSELNLPAEPNNFQFEELTSFEFETKHIKTDAGTNIHISQSKDINCIKFYEKHILPRKTLTPKLKHSENNISVGINELNEITPDFCNHPQSKMFMAETLKQVLMQHHNQILILIGSSYSGNDLYSMDQSINTLKSSSNFPIEITKVQLSSNPEDNQRMVFDQISSRLPSLLVLIGKDYELSPLLTMSKKYLIPSIVMSPNENLQANYPYAYRVYPSQETMAKHLVEYLATKGIKKFGMLMSIQNNHNKFFDSFVTSVKNKNMEIIAKESFDRNQSNTMQKASEILFKIDPNLRGEEYAALIEEAQKTHSNTLNEKELEKIRLKPQFDFEAVLISDHFRVARFFANQFKFIGAPKIILLGNHEWRDPSLVDPPDVMLNGSLFVDFLGKKSSIPQNLHEFIEEENGFLFSKDSKINIDTLVLSYTALWVAKEAIDSNLTKQQILKKLKMLKPIFPGLNQQTIFDSNRNMNWPTYIFTIAGKDIVEVAQYNSTAQSQTIKN